MSGTRCVMNAINGKPPVWGVARSRIVSGTHVAADRTYAKTPAMKMMSSPLTEPLTECSSHQGIPGQRTRAMVTTIITPTIAKSMRAGGDMIPRTMRLKGVSVHIEMSAHPYVNSVKTQIKKASVLSISPSLGSLVSPMDARIWKCGP